MPEAYSPLESSGCPLFCYCIQLAVIFEEGMTLHTASFIVSRRVFRISRGPKGRVLTSCRRAAERASKFAQALGGPFKGKSHEDFGNFQSLLAERRLKSIYDARIEVGPGSLYDRIAGLEG